MDKKFLISAMSAVASFVISIVTLIHNYLEPIRRDLLNINYRLSRIEFSESVKAQPKPPSPPKLK
jgi:hypothetical protein